MNKAKQVMPLMLFFSLVVVLGVFQNCESYQPRAVGLDLNAKAKGNNGDGYSGMVFIYPKVTESGSNFSIESTAFVLEGFEFELLQGDAQIQPFPDQTGAFVQVGSDYIGTLVLRIVEADGSEQIIEIQVIEPVPVTFDDKASSYGGLMVVAENRIVTSVPRRDLHDLTNIGKVIVYNVSDSGEIQFNESFPSPVIPEEGHSYFGSALAAPGNKNLFAGSGELNAVFRYVHSEVEGFQRPRYVLKQKIVLPNSVEFGAWVFALGEQLAVSDPGANQGRGAIYFYERSDKGYELVKALNGMAPVEGEGQYLRFGRFFEITSKFVFVSAKFINEAGVERGSLLVFDRDFRFVQEIRPATATLHWGKNFKILGDRLFVSGYGVRDSALARGQVRFYKWSESESQFVEAQRFNSPGQPDQYTDFGRSIAVAGDYLFVGSPDEDSHTQTGSGVVHYYRFSLDSNQYVYAGPITPTYEKYAVVSKLGRELVANDTTLFLSYLGQSEPEGLKRGDIVTIPLNSVGE